MTSLETKINSSLFSKVISITVVFLVKIVDYQWILIFFLRRLVQSILVRRKVRVHLTCRKSTLKLTKLINVLLKIKITSSRIHIIFIFNFLYLYKLSINFFQVSFWISRIFLNFKTRFSFFIKKLVKKDPLECFPLKPMGLWFKEKSKGKKG